MAHKGPRCALFRSPPLQRAESLGQLVGARRPLASTRYALEALNNLSWCQPFDKSTYAFKISITPAIEGHICNTTILIELKFDLARACSGCCIRVLHFNLLLNTIHSYPEHLNRTAMSLKINVLEAGLEPAQPQWPRDFKSLVSTIPPFERPTPRRAIPRHKQLQR